VRPIISGAAAGTGLSPPDSLNCAWVFPAFARSLSAKRKCETEVCVKWLLPSGLAMTLILMASLAAAGQGHETAAADNQRETAIALEQEGKNAEAEAAWRGLLMVQPANSEAYAHLGLLKAHQEHYREAVALYREALALNPGMPGLRMNLGLALFKAGELKEAIEIFDSLRKRQLPSSPEALRLITLIGLAHYGLDEYAAAVPYLKEATASDSQNLPFRLILAHSCLWARQFQCVLDVYHEILTLNAESAEADMLAGEALDEMQDHAGATQQFRAAVKANPKEPNVHFGLGYLLWAQSQYDEAAQEFQAELTNVPDNAQALAYLADTQIKMNHPEAAFPLIEKTIRLSPGMELAHLDLGILYAQAGRRKDALQELRVAAKLSPNDVNVHWRLARLYHTMGRTDEANAEFQKTRRLTKAADDSVFSKLDSARAKNNPTLGRADAPGDK
jgi:tetratricopeptide (TPR) repeat protein